LLCVIVVTLLLDVCGAACSRNARLSPEARINALSISQALRWAEQAVQQRQVTASQDIVAEVRQRITAAGGEVDYVQVGWCSRQISCCWGACGFAAGAALSVRHAAVPALLLLYSAVCLSHQETRHTEDLAGMRMVMPTADGSSAPAAVAVYCFCCAAA
jgi:hypothetical protein